MALTPLDIQEKEFGTGLFGYKKAEVDEFLEEVAEALKDLQRENNALRDQVAKLEKDLEKLRQEERNIKEALLKAQELAESIKKQAEAEAKEFLLQAREEADQLIKEAKDKRDQILLEIETLKSEREKIFLELRTFLKTWEEYLEKAFGS
ncbi:MAG: DivIVA domain-containing protein [Thermodesulfobacteria bacterium]|nr:DivIVA domain-containing protein [Thermodesulfobacteriota bacterium]